MTSTNNLSHVSAGQPCQGPARPPRIIHPPCSDTPGAIRQAPPAVGPYRGQRLVPSIAPHKEPRCSTTPARDHLY
jgi:hypothetical protein